MQDKFTPTYFPCLPYLLGVLARPQKPDLEWNIPRGMPLHFGACASPSGIFVFKTPYTYFGARITPPSH